MDNKEYTSHGGILNNKMRYGKYSICNQDMDGIITYKDNEENTMYTQDPRDIALSRDIIGKFGTHK